jgi:hypothetical protein
MFILSHFALNIETVHIGARRPTVLGLPLQQVFPEETVASEHTTKILALLAMLKNKDRKGSAHGYLIKQTD